MNQALHAVAKRPTTQRLPSVQRRDDILKAAATLYLDAGPSRTTTRQIAQAVGISQPSLYAHFPTKDAISYALAENAFAVLERRMTADFKEYGTAKSEFETVIKSYIAFALEEPSAYKIAFMLEFDLGPDAILSLQEHCGLRAFGMFRDRIADLQSRGFVRQGSTEIIAQSIWAAMHGLCALLLARPSFPWADLNTLIATHTDLIVSGAQPSQD